MIITMTARNPSTITTTIAANTAVANPTLRLAHGAHQKVISPIYVVLVLAWYIVVLCMVYMGKWTCKYGTLYTDWHFVI